MSGIESRVIAGVLFGMHTRESTSRASLDSPPRRVCVCPMRRGIKWSVLWPDGRRIYQSGCLL